MTNKKFKVAAMSMALTACVAAQPLIANAADDVNAVSNEPTGSAPQSEEGSSVSAPVAVASEGSSNTEVKAEEKQDMLAPDEHLGEYSEPKTDPEGSSTSKADITKDAPDKEQHPEPDTDTTKQQPGTESGSSDGSADGETKEQIPIGESTPGRRPWSRPFPRSFPVRWRLQSEAALQRMQSVPWTLLRL